MLIHESPLKQTSLYFGRCVVPSSHAVVFAMVWGPGVVTHAVIGPPHSKDNAVPSQFTEMLAVFQRVAIAWRRPAA